MGEIMTLRQKQSKFVAAIGKLIQWADDHDYSLTFGDAYRDPRLHGTLGETHGEMGFGYGSKNSCHKLRLAVDFNLFIDGEYKSGTDDYRPLGEYWESIGGSWGGRFKDGNHFSFEYNGHR